MIMIGINNTWIALPRNFCNCSFYEDATCTYVYIYLLLNAARQDSWFGENIITKGQYHTTITKLCDTLNITRKKMRLSLDKLEGERVLHKESNTHKGIKITIMNFDCFLNVNLIQGGWVKLYDAFKIEEWFYVPNVFRVYLHLMFKLQGQEDTYTMFSSLIEELNISKAELLKILIMLQKEGLINVASKGYKNIHSVKLLDFEGRNQKLLSVESEPFPMIEDAEFEEFETKKTHLEKDQNKTKTGLKQDQNRAKTFEGSKNAINTCLQSVTDSISDIYDVLRPKQDQNRTKTFEGVENVINTCLTLENQKTHPLARKEVYKDKEKEKIKNISSTSINNNLVDNYKTRERVFFDKLAENGNWINLIQTRFGLSSFEEIVKLLSDFIMENEARLHEGHKDIRDFANHFCDWLKKLLKERAAMEVEKINKKFNAHGIQYDRKRDIPTSAFDENGNNIYESEIY